MHISHEWLGEFVAHGKAPEALRDLITAHIATVEGFERTRAELAPFVVGLVVASEKIPETRLSFNKVDDGRGTLLDVVCGAPNVVVGTRYPFARTGTTMPGGLVIEKRKIRGFTSNGMLCSPRELGLGDDHDGILALDTTAAPGTPLLEALPLSDVSYDVDVLPNRPDLLSHRGLARDVAAVTGGVLRLPRELDGLPSAPRPAAGARDAADGGVSVRVEDASDCPRYMAMIVRGVAVGPSPEWLRRRIEAIGGRSISNVVDATNYILHGFGQPVHAFDLARIGGSAIVVRRARAGETLTTLDGVARKLDEPILVIADATSPTALAGIMGGQASEVTGATTDVLVEVATFAPKVVRAGRRLLGLSTDASYRYERGTDEAALAEVAAIAAGLIARVAGGQVTSAIEVGADPGPRAAVALRPERVGRLLGDEVATADIRAILSSLGFAVREAGDVLEVTPPSWRHDVSRDVDLIEDIARMRGYDRLPDAIGRITPSSVPDHPMHVAGRRVRDALVALGLSEVRPLPYAPAADVPRVRVLNPIGDDEPFLRESLLATLGWRAEYNLSRMQGDVRLFEIGTAFIPADGAVVKEEMRVAALVMGRRRPPHFTEPRPPAFDAWDAKAIGEAIARAAWPGGRVQLVPAGNGALWSVVMDGTPKGVVRQVALDAPVWAAPAFGVEITLGKMPATPPAAHGAHDYSRAGRTAAARPALRYAPLPTQPAAEFDLALLVPDGVPAADVERLIRAASGDTLESVAVFDEYRGENVPSGTRSLAWRLTFRHPERTLRDRELDGRRTQILKTLEREIGVRVRAG